jgi:3-oxoacyl-(acyl-carrier-protein) synthase
MDRVTQFAVSASQQAINDAGLNLETEDLERFGVLSWHRHGRRRLNRRGLRKTL